MAILLGMNDTTFTTPIGANNTLHTIEYEMEYDVDDETRRPTAWVDLLAAITPSGERLTIEDAAAREGVDPDELHDQLDELARKHESERLGRAVPDEYYEQAAEFQDEPADLDEGFDPYMGQYTDDC